jgi:hypothetical protein
MKDVYVSEVYTSKWRQEWGLDSRRGRALLAAVAQVVVADDHGRSAKPVVKLTARRDHVTPRRSVGHLVMACPHSWYHLL